MRKRIYISGPLHSSGCAAQNVHEAIKAHVSLMRLGYAPLCPHLTHQIDPGGIFSHQDWIAVDLTWVLVSSAVLRIPGSSVGADKEVAFADVHNIPVYYSIPDLLRAMPPR